MSEEKAVRKDNNVLAEGEVTGHAHVASGTGAEVWEIPAEVAGGKQVVLKAPKGATVTHEEHHQVSVPPGEYDVSRVREYDPFMEEAKQVAD